ncbi:MAG: radical SAM protein, partial [Desulfobacteraceae bacterium]
QLTAEFDYQTGLFDSATLVRFGRFYTAILEKIMKDPNRKLSGIALYSDAEREKIAAFCNQHTVDQNIGPDLLTQFEEQASRTPDHPAVLFENRQWSYADLNSEANRLAHFLIRHGISNRSLIAVCHDRPADNLIQLLAIWKAGAAYMPLDFKSPPERIGSMLKDSEADAVLTFDAVTQTVPYLILKNLNDLEKEIHCTAKRAQITDLDPLPFPDRNLLDQRKYDSFFSDACVKNNISILSSRGCPYQCSFCHNIWPKKHIVRTTENLYEEVRYYYDKGYRTFSMIDDIFNLDRRRSESFFNLIVKNRLKLRILFPNGLRGDLLTNAEIDLMAEAGVINISLALESGSPRIQRLIHKNINLDILRDRLDYICTRHPGIIANLFTMIGFPSETEAEALMTLDFIKNTRFLHFPYINVLKIYPNTEIATLAIAHGISAEAIHKSSNLFFHDMNPECLPFSESFVREIQSKLISDYILLPERLEKVIEAQSKVLSHEEITAKYNIYLPGGIDQHSIVKNLIGSIYAKNESISENFKDILYPSIRYPRMKNASPSKNENPLKTLLLDLSQHFSHESDKFEDTIETPIGLLYLAGYLNQVYGNRVRVSIKKSMVDFDDYEELNQIIRDFKPHVIGIRTLSYYKSFFHKTVSLIKSWAPEASIISGGPYATSEYRTLLSDRNIDLIIQGEGETTFAELIGAFIKNNHALPGDKQLRAIDGVVFIPKDRSQTIRSNHWSRSVFILDRLHSELSTEKTDNPGVDAATLAYVIFTSGSTGVPKGVEITRTAITSHVNTVKHLYDLKSTDHFLNFAFAHLDVSIEQMLTPLISGATVALLPTRALSASIFFKKLSDLRITAMDLPPLFWREMLLELYKKQHTLPKSIRIIILGGDVMPVDILALTKECGLEHIRLLNAYGPTEATVTSTIHEIPPVMFSQPLPPRISIGRPLPNRSIYILDRAGNLRPMGLPGELCIGGPCLAAGYLNRPLETSRHFIPNLFHPAQSSRLYKTGDRCRLLEDGNIDFLGRLDHQVSIRGFRVELNEIETAIETHPAIRKALAQYQELSANGNRLIAHVVLHRQNGFDPEELRRYLAKRLPDYMIPVNFHQWDESALKTDGTIDCARIQTKQTNTWAGKENRALTTETEKKLALFWKNILAVDNVDKTSHFIKSGGHSLFAIRLVSRINETFNVDMTLKDLFKALSLEEMAAKIDSLSTDKCPTPVSVEKTEKLERIEI